MSIEVKLPNLGEGIEAGDVLEIKVSEGDTITKGQGILELETDKASVEVPSSQAGRVTKIHVTSGQTVRVGAVLLTLEPVAATTGSVASPPPSSPSVGSAATAPSPAAPAPASPSAGPQRPPAPAAPGPVASSQPSAAPAPPAPPPVASVGLAAPATGSSNMTGGHTLTAAGPAVRRFAREAGVDLSRVVGTGEAGRITRDDVLHALHDSSAGNNGGGAATTAPRPVTATGDAVASAATELPGARFQDDWGAVRIQPMSRIRKTIAAKMHESWSTVPRVTNFDDADVTELERLRQSSKRDYEKSGIKLTALPFVIKAIAMALKDHPVLNASVDMQTEQIIYKEYVNVGIAVDTDRGLVVPSLRDVTEKSIADIARDLRVISQKARDNSFAVEDFRGSTFTISNLGAIGGTYSTPIVNTPEVAILLVGRSRKLPMVIDDEIQIRLMMPLSLSYDHRLVDGAAAARFLSEVIEYLAAPGRLLLAP